MEYILRTDNNYPNETLTITELQAEGIIISACDGGSPEHSVELSKEELHEFIGVLLHVQARLKNQ